MSVTPFALTGGRRPTDRRRALCGAADVRAAAKGAATATGVFVAWFVAVSFAPQVHPTRTAHEVALFAHLASLVAGLGAVIAIDWLALLWMLGRRTFAEVTRTASGLHTLIWGGLATLVLSGALLEPDTSSALTRFKLALVLVIGVNGLHAATLQPQLRATRGEVSGDLMARAAATAVISQLGWWAAVLIGFHNSQR